MRRNFLFIIVTCVLFTACKNKKNPVTTIQNKKIETPKRVSINYSLLVSKDSINAFLKLQDSATLQVIGAVNRADVKFLKKFDSLLVPLNTKEVLQQYFPFPFHAAFLKNVKKIIFFSYPSQSFAAYENGELVYTGPTNMGRKADQTPTGLFYTNWKAEETTSTFNDEWNLKWNFNIENKLGVGFHEYEMPGYPTSHSCLRLSEKDAKYLYAWADQWNLQGTDNVLAKGTPVVVFGAYPFGSSKPWLALVQNERTMEITEENLQTTVQQFLPDILQKQAQRDSMDIIPAK
ncbi:MAG: L,D-transpeptidase [Ferruginibacter sp.]